MKNRGSLLILILLFLASCTQETPQPTEKPEVSGFLGRWEIQQRSINNISSGAAICCEFLEFSADENPEDFSGNFLNTASGSETEGTFTLDPKQSEIHFEFSDKTLTYSYTVGNQFLSFSYQENGDTYSEGWVFVE